jgi:iron-sulfur cluster assembly protein
MTTVAFSTPKEMPISLTESAVTYVQKRIQKAGKGTGLRLSVKKSGCTGYGYVVDLLEETHADDKIFPQSENLLVAVDHKSYPFVQGTKIDYVKEGLNGKLKFYNPNEAHSCGCGESFSVEIDAEGV